MRKDLEEFYYRKEFLKDVSRSESVKKRHKKGSRTARENIEDLCDKDSFDELGSLIVAGQSQRLSRKELIKKTFYYFYNNYILHSYCLAGTYTKKNLIFI